MKIMDILVRDAVVLDLEAQEKPAALEEMANALAAAEPSVDAAGLLQVLLDHFVVFLPFVWYPMNVA